jgi:hypothetical protein
MLASVAANWQRAGVLHLNAIAVRQMANHIETEGAHCRAGFPGYTYEPSTHAIYVTSQRRVGKPYWRL